MRGGRRTRKARLQEPPLPSDKFFQPCQRRWAKCLGESKSANRSGCAARSIFHPAPPRATFEFRRLRNPRDRATRSKKSAGTAIQKEWQTILTCPTPDVPAPPSNLKLPA